MAAEVSVVKKKSKITEILRRLWKDNSYVFALAVLLIFGAFASDAFFSSANLFNVLRQVSIVGIIALGMTFVIISGGIDLSVGSLLAVSGVVILVSQKIGVPIPASVLLGCLTGTAIGAVNGVVIAKAKLAPFIVTLATMTIARSMVIFLSDGSSIIGDANSPYTLIGTAKIGSVPIPVLIFSFMIILSYLLLNKTKFGRYVFAIGGNETNAFYSGIKVAKVKIITYALLGFSVGISAMIETARLASVSSSSSGMYYEMDAIAAVIIGGTSLSGGKGNIMGTVVGIIILGVIGNLMNLMNISPYLNGAVKGLIILVAVLIQRRGN